MMVFVGWEIHVPKGGNIVYIYLISIAIRLTLKINWLIFLYLYYIKKYCACLETFSNWIELLCGVFPIQKSGIPPGILAEFAGVVPGCCCKVRAELAIVFPPKFS